jgi:replication factor C small subunit
MRNPEDFIWTEKYRPKTLSEIIGQEAIVERLRSFVQKRRFTSMIFSGEPGIGKTTCAIAFANDLFGEDRSEAFRELNASVTPDTPLLVERAGKVERTTIGHIAEAYFGKGSSEKYAHPKDLKVLSINKKTLKVEFLPVRNISRHRISKIRKIRFETGGVNTTLNHSVMIIDGNGALASVMAKALKAGDLLVTFKTALEGGSATSLDMSRFAPNEFVSSFNGGRFRNPKIRNVLTRLDVDSELSWFFGSYMAEGVTGMKAGTSTSGVTVLTYAYPKEMPIAQRSAEVFGRMGFTAGLHTIVSGTSGRESGVQVTGSSTQLARFLRENFYIDGALSKTARYKKVPGFVFGLPIEQRHEFLKGYAGDASGEWGDYLRYSSVSENLLVDTAWLARISGLESSVFNKESRIVWKKPTCFYAYSDLLPAEPFMKFLKGIDAGFNWRYELRHSMYHKMAKRLDRRTALSVLERIQRHALAPKKRAQLDRLKAIAQSDISALKIKHLEDAEYDGYVYDVSVPDSEMFWGGTTPVLLHNSDDRGIDVVRGAIKEFAKTVALATVSTKIIFLDEADSLTSDAQHALRRIMEKYANETVFILSANYASKIIEPIQSRCVVFRFKPLDEACMREYIARIAKGEGLDIDEGASKALIDVSDGDLRKLTNLLQSAAAHGKKITEARIYDVAARARPKEIVAMLKYAIDGNFESARIQLDEVMLKHGMRAEDVLTQCYKEVQNMNVEERMKLSVIKQVGECNFRIVEGANERIQLEAFLASLALLKAA